MHASAIDSARNASLLVIIITIISNKKRNPYTTKKKLIFETSRRVVPSVTKNNSNIIMSKKISVGVDGSDAHMAFLCASYLRKPEDKLAVFHISSPDKDYLPYDLQPSYIAENYDNLLLSSIPKDRRSVTITEKKKKDKVPKVLYVNI